LCHGAFFGIGAVVATSLVAPGQRSRAIALMFAGLTLANIFGVPLGTALGQWAGWRAAFWAIVPIGVIAAVAVAWLLPKQADAAPTRLLREFGVLRRPQVILAMSMSVLASASLFSVFTYIAPLLETVTGLSPHHVTFVLLLFGVGITIGNLVGGRLADWRQTPALIGIFSAYAVVGASLAYASHSPTPAIVCVLLWGAVSFSPGAALQTRVVDHAFEAPNLASTLNQSAFNLGNAMGAWSGGIALSAGASYDSLPWLAAAFALAALGLAVVSAVLGRGRAGLVVRAG
jgi:DHA1 family inner membrane transport protein